MSKFMILLKKNLIEMLRNKRFIIFISVFSMLSFISAISAKFIPVLIDIILEDMGGISGGDMFLFEASVADSYAQFISNFGEIAVLLVLVLFVNTIIKEKNSGMYASLKMNRVNDKEIVFGHFVAQFILVSVSFLLSVAVFVLLNIIFFKQIMGIRGFVALVYIYLLLICAICFSLFVSCICKSKGPAYLITILGYFILGILEIIPKINRVNPLHLLSLSNNLMYYQEYSLTEHLTTALCSVIICILLVAGALLLVKNRINNKRGITSDISAGV